MAFKSVRKKNNCTCLFVPLPHNWIPLHPRVKCADVAQEGHREARVEERVQEAVNKVVCN